MNRLIWLLLVCLAACAYADESTVPLKSIWREKTDISPSLVLNIPLSPAGIDRPSMLADCNTVTRVLSLWRISNSGMQRLAEKAEDFYPNGAAYGDIDHDGKSEFIFIGFIRDSNARVIVAARLEGDELASTVYPIEKGSSYRGIAVGDMDGDGNNEVVYYRKDKVGEEYWEGSLVMARVEGGELKTLGESNGHRMVGSIAIADFDGDNQREVAVLEGHGLGKNEEIYERAPHLAAYSWVDGQWAKEPKAMLPVDPSIDLCESPSLVAWKDGGKPKALVASYQTIKAYEMSEGKWSDGEVVATIDKGSIRCLGATDLEGKGKESILAWVHLPGNEPDNLGQPAMYVYQREN